MAEVLHPLVGVADEIVIVDSGSSDATESIAAAYGARFVRHALENFTAQREFAEAICAHRWILAIDSDEVVSKELAARLIALKAADFVTPNRSEAFAIHREWYLLGRRVHCCYPMSCPDWPVRLFDRTKVHYIAGAHIHECVTGYSRSERIDELLLHYTCDTLDDLYGKLNLYSTLAARDLLARRIRPSWLRIVVFPWLIWVRWYLVRGGWRDGIIGLIHARYVRDLVYQKHLKLKFDLSTGSSAQPSVRTSEPLRSNHIIEPRA